MLFDRSKARVYTTEIKDDDVISLIEAVGSLKEILPLKYIGIPISTRKWNIKDEKMLSLTRVKK